MKDIRFHHIFFFLAAGGIVLAAFNFNPPTGGQPLFQNLDQFVLFAEEEIKLEQGVQVSSGDLGTNGKLNIQKEVIVNGNLFADRITIDKDSQINGHVSFNTLETKKETKILGTQTKPVSLPIANLPEILAFQIGTQDFKFEGQANTLPAGHYRDITLEKNGRLILSGGTYNLRELELKDNSTLIFNAPTISNIQFKLKGQKHVSILPGQSFKPTDLVINYLGIRAKQEKDQKEDDDDEINALHDEKEKKENKEGKIGRPVLFGKDSFLNFKLLAPKASVKIGEASTLRGQVLGRKVKVEKDSVLSREMNFLKSEDPSKIIEDQGLKFFVNEIIILFKDETTLADIQKVADLVGGKVVGVIPAPVVGILEVQTTTASELNNKIQLIQNSNNPLIISIVQNLIGK
ncbi:MAG: hypothetical protein Q8Q46_02530 [Candidatus Giovannonibacteria bacterium]|nr:hypothetical protein [Candidatus Giovannonibacteria bacterium]